MVITIILFNMFAIVAFVVCVYCWSWLLVSFSNRMNTILLFISLWVISIISIILMVFLLGNIVNSYYIVERLIN